MDAVHLMRAITGRDLIVKVEGCYHGHHDSVMVSVSNEKDEIGPAERPYSAPSGTGIPRAITDLTLIVPFNDLDALERLFEEHRGQIAGMILEPIMMNAGVIPPEQGYLEGVREIVHEHGALLAFDEVKCGVTTAYGGASGYLGVSPDMVCLAKAIGGGVPCGAIGGTEEVMGRIADGTYDQVGTFNGNPLTMAASRATLTEILTPEAYEHFDRLARIMSEGVAGRRRGVRPRRLPAGVRGQGVRNVLRPQGPKLQGLPGARRPFQPGALALPAQRRRLLAAVGQGGAVDALGAALRGRRQALRGQLREPSRGRLRK